MDEDEIKDRLAAVTEEHRDLDEAIHAMLEKAGHDQLRLQRMKKRKLVLKDAIGRFEDMLFPDIIA
ncbi:MAG: DUF465 domain-containing protein [Sphingomonadales bacterium]|nr:DUF465 domain-containing protein [Sphingomonadales bacterium]